MNWPNNNKALQHIIYVTLLFSKPNIMKIYFSLILSLMMSYSAVAQVNNSVIVKSIKMHKVEEVIFDAVQSVEVNTWERSYARVFLKVETEGLKGEEMKELLRSQRYKMETKLVEGKMHISFPNLTEELPQDFWEEVSIQCVLPEHMQYDEAFQMTADLDL